MVRVSPVLALPFLFLFDAHPSFLPRNSAKPPSSTPLTTSVFGCGRLLFFWPHCGLTVLNMLTCPLCFLSLSRAPPSLATRRKKRPAPSKWVCPSRVPVRLSKNAPMLTDAVVSASATQGEMVAYCTNANHGTRVIPEGTIQGLQFLTAPDYIEVRAQFARCWTRLLALFLFPIFPDRRHHRPDRSGFPCQRLRE